MNWYSQMKTSALDKEWWVQMYKHLTETAAHFFPEETRRGDNRRDSLPRLVSHSFSSGVDGDHVFFSYIVMKNCHEYRCSVSLYFSGHVNGAAMHWENTNLTGILPKEQSFVRATWHVIRDFFDRNNVENVGYASLSGDNAKPYNIIEAHKNAIDQDGDENQDGPEPVPTEPDPSLKKPMPVPVRPSRHPVGV